MRCDFNKNENDQNKEAKIRNGDHILQPKESFRYLGSVIHKSVRIEDDVTHRIQAGWLKNEDAKVDLWRPQPEPVRIVESITIEGVRRRGRPKLRWEDKLKTDLKELLLSEDMTFDRNSWRIRIRVDEEDV
ncbi:hypothetical protein Tco_0448249 [Tanacetum coccineum]